MKKRVLAEIVLCLSAALFSSGCFECDHSRSYGPRSYGSPIRIPQDDKFWGEVGKKAVDAAFGGSKKKHSYSKPSKPLKKAYESKKAPKKEETPEYKKLNSDLEELLKNKEFKLYYCRLKTGNRHPCRLEDLKKSIDVDMDDEKFAKIYIRKQERNNPEWVKIYNFKKKKFEKKVKDIEGINDYGLRLFGIFKAMDDTPDILDYFVSNMLYDNDMPKLFRNMDETKKKNKLKEIKEGIDRYDKINPTWKDHYKTVGTDFKIWMKFYNEESDREKAGLLRLTENEDFRTYYEMKTRSLSAGAKVARKYVDMVADELGDLDGDSMERLEKKHPNWLKCYNLLKELGKKK